MSAVGCHPRPLPHKMDPGSRPGMTGGIEGENDLYTFSPHLSLSGLTRQSIGDSPLPPHQKMDPGSRAGMTLHRVVPPRRIGLASGWSPRPWDVPQGSRTRGSGVLAPEARVIRQSIGDSPFPPHHKMDPGSRSGMTLHRVVPPRRIGLASGCSPGFLYSRLEWPRQSRCNSPRWLTRSGPRLAGQLRLTENRASTG